METLLRKLFSKQKQEVSTLVSANKIKPLFNSLGIDIETIGFPDMNKRNKDPFEGYWVNFKDVKITPYVDNDELKISVTGKYETQSKCSGRDSSHNWYPGRASSYSFRIKDNNLKIKRKKDFFKNIFEF